jgi:hypothetical protein
MNQQLQYIVGIRRGKQTDHVVVAAEDALIAALKVKATAVEAMITYVRRVNRRGDARHQPHALPDPRRRPRTGTASD